MPAQAIDAAVPDFFGRLVLMKDEATGIARWKVHFASLSNENERAFDANSYCCADGVSFVSFAVVYQHVFR
ncbi:hypothetical protein RSSM_01338 [Rhodopirellula sallentina SM41]|uniref:Uncharacterized protein n=1 Tax=Rhodopirellula sallentina SM41 TaxID=1263870 RepID=M5U6Y6_9BACT|nr:hypothetical protein RSSM_01338 [Rhodopirellula sallentina SM41]